MNNINNMNRRGAFLLRGLLSVPVGLGVVLAALLVVQTSVALAQADPEQSASVAPNQTSPAARLSKNARLDECRALATTNKRLRGQVMNDLRPAIQEQDANFTVKNKKHVVMAYAALWILTVGFVVLLFVRQRSLLAEIARLRKEVQAAAEE